mgnify:CR=1 FL=1
MNFKKIIFLIIVLIPLNACLQSTALMGPGVTVATSGNIAQAGFQYGANSALKKETGADAIGHIKNIVEEEQDSKTIEKQRHIHKTIRTIRNRILAVGSFLWLTILYPLTVYQILSALTSH